MRYIRDTKFYHINQIVVGVSIFGLVLFNFLAIRGFLHISSRDAMIRSGQYFLYLWMIMFFVNIIHSIYRVVSKPKVKHTFDFNQKLRKLEKLKDDDLITDYEYNQKRQQIMSENW
jgi:cbb3-type cytochrome oxidase subunit 3